MTDPEPKLIDPDRNSSRQAERGRRLDDIGRGRRWYDLPYRMSRSLYFAKPMPKMVKTLLRRFSDLLLVFHSLEREKADLRNPRISKLNVPGGERFTHGGIWVIEFFPPSCFSALHESLRKNGWDKRDPFILHDGSNAEKVERARRGSGFSWSRLGIVTNVDFESWEPGATREKLPREFSKIEITAMQLGKGLTAVVAHFSLTKHGQHAIGDAWCAEHEPRIVWKRFFRPVLEDRYFAGIHSTQSERARLHNDARKWLASRCSGYFAETVEGQPVVDFGVFWKFDPTSEVGNRFLGDPMRSLGMESNALTVFVSKQLPGLVLAPPETNSFSSIVRNAWGVVGAYDEVSRLNNSPGYGIRPHSVATLANIVDDEIREFAMHTAIQQYIREMKTTYSKARDLARKHHGSFKPRRLKQLRSEVLRTSLDLPVMARDTYQLWDPKWKFVYELEVKAYWGPGHKGEVDEKFNLIEHFGQIRSDGFEELLQEDATYRDVLSSAASLGSSAESSSLGRWALVASGASFVIALSAVLLASTGENTVWSKLVTWLGGLMLSERPRITIGSLTSPTKADTRIFFRMSLH